MASYTKYQLQFKIKLKNDIHLTYPLVIYFQQVIDLVAMSLRLQNIKYLILIRKEFSNYIEERVLKTKTIKRLYKFILKDIFSKYGSIKRMKVD